MKEEKKYEHPEMKPRHPNYLAYTVFFSVCIIIICFIYLVWLI